MDSGPLTDEQADGVVAGPESQPEPVTASTPVLALAFGVVGVALSGASGFAYLRARRQTSTGQPVGRWASSGAIRNEAGPAQGAPVPSSGATASRARRTVSFEGSGAGVTLLAAPAVRYCASCGSSVEPGHRYCAECGRKFGR